MGLKKNAKTSFKVKKLANTEIHSILPSLFCGSFSKLVPNSALFTATACRVDVWTSRLERVPEFMHRDVCVP